MSSNSVYIHLRESIGEIAPELYGHFQEHIGTGVYGGIWVGEEGDRENIGGLRTDTIELLTGLNPPVIRWPGGCFADDYHWRDGVGSREERPRRRNLWWLQGEDELHVEEPNHFGTDEFVQFCREVGAEPYLAVNVGSGTVEEAIAWLEYCNYDGDTDYARMRAENGHGEPHDVTYWGVGNENWSCGGQYEPEQYGYEFNRYANYLSKFDAGMLGGDNIELIACGNADPEWNRKLLDVSSPEHLGIHYYIGKNGCGDGCEFTEEEYYRLLAESLNMDYFIRKAAAVIDVLSPRTTIAVDEWGIWHPQATHGNGLTQDNTVRDGIAAASFLDTFNANADVVSMANIAQMVDVLQCVVQTDDEQAWPTPTYQVFNLYEPHMGSTAVRTHDEAETISVEGEDHDLPLVSSSASVTDGELYVTVTNRHLTEDREIELKSDIKEFGRVRANVIFAGLDAHEYSTAENADAFAPSEHSVEVADHGTLYVTIPSSSIVGITIEQ